MGAFGIQLGKQSVVSNVRARWNGFFGIEVGASSRVSGCAANDNGVAGIVLTGGKSIVSGNTADNNGTIGLGTSSGSGSLFERNTASGNGFGMQTFLNDAYRGNVLTGNTTSAINEVDGPAQNLGANYCQGAGVTSPTCP